MVSLVVALHGALATPLRAACAAFARLHGGFGDASLLAIQRRPDQFAVPEVVWLECPHHGG
jgi:hypothetical protein